MSHPLGIKYVSDVAKSKGYSVINEEEYKNQDSYLFLIDKDGYKYSPTIRTFLNNLKSGCLKFHSFYSGNIFTTENIHKWIENNKKTFKYLSGDYERITKRNLIFECLCGNIFKCSLSDIITGGKDCCNSCSKEKMGRRLSRENVLEIFNSCGLDIVKEFKYLNNRTKFLVKCRKCGFTWERAVGTLSSKKSCPKCKQSKGEIKISSFLILSDIDFVIQKKFENCKDISVLPFDFYLPNQNILIEYNGEQHYKVNEFFGGKEGFKAQKKRDKIKAKYCKENDIPLLIIPYTEFERIEEIITSFLKI